MSLEKVKSVFHRWLYIEDDDYLDVGLAAVLAHRFEGDPVWLFLVGAPGSGKTQFLSALQSKHIYPLSQLTPNTLVSGLNQPGKRDPSILPELDGKVLVVKDLTAILSENPKIRAQLFGQLRDVYDGTTAKAFGSGVKTRRYTSHVGLIAGVTPIIETYQSLDHVLGERFLSYRIRYLQPEKATEKAMRNSGQQGSMRDKLTRVVVEFLDQEWPTSVDDVFVPEPFAKMIMSLANSVAMLRTTVPKNRAGAVEYVPEIEVPTRLAVQLTKLGIALTTVRGAREFGEAEYATLLKVARHSTPSIRIRLVSELAHLSGPRCDYIANAELSSKAELPASSVRVAMEDLFTLGLLERKGEKPVRWRPSSRLKTALAQSEFLLKENELGLSVAPLPTCARESN